MKERVEYIELLVDKLTELQISLRKAYNSLTFLRYKSDNITKAVTAYQLAFYKLVDTVPGLISNLHASIGASLCFDKTTELLRLKRLTDRKYQGRDRRR